MLVAISSKSVFIRNRFHAKLVLLNSSRNRALWTRRLGLLKFDSPVAYGKLLEPRLSKSRLSWSESRHFGAISHVKRAPSNRQSQKNVTKTRCFRGSRSFKVIDVGTRYLRKARQQCLLVMISSMSILAWNRFHAIRVNSSKITTFYGVGLLLFDEFVWKELLNSAARNCVTKQ